LWLRTVRLSGDAAVRLLDVFHERTREGRAQYPEFAPGKLNKTCGRWDTTAPCLSGVPSPSTQLPSEDHESGYCAKTVTFLLVPCHG